MPPKSKFDDVPFEKVVYTGKIFIYNEPKWDVLFPIVDIIRLLKKNTIIGYKYGKGQKNIQMYGLQYFCNVIGNDLHTKKDYLENLKAVKCIYIFNDRPDATATSLLNAAKVNSINVVCYSNIDNLYHFYEQGDPEKVLTIKKPEDVIAKMYELDDLQLVRKIHSLFPDFEIIENEECKERSTLENCMDKLKISTEIEKSKIPFSRKVDNYLVLFDPHSNKLKKAEYERQLKKPVAYGDEPPKKKSIFSSFFKKMN
jgi:hypothetical protein